MLTLHTFRTSFVAIFGLLSVTMVTPVMAQVPDPDQIVAAAPAGPSWDDISGYGSVEASRAVAVPDDGVFLSGALVSRSSDLGSLQEEYLAAPAPSANTIANQVSGDVRWAPAVPSWDETSGYATVEETRAAMTGKEGAALFAPRVSRVSDLGSMQEDSFAAPSVASWDEISGYGAVEASRAAATP